MVSQTKLHAPIASSNAMTKKGDDNYDSGVGPPKSGYEADMDMETRSMNYGRSFLETEPTDNDDLSPIEEVNLTVDTNDDPSLPVWTFRMWFLGLSSCAFLAFVNQFFSYRTEPLSINSLAAQIVCLPLGRFMALTLPNRVIGQGRWWGFSLNPGPFNMKEHVLITIFANAGAGGAYAINIVTIVKVLYKRNISFIAALMITITTQMIGYGWAGIFRNFLIKPGVMWWPSTLVQVALFRTLHEPDKRRKGGFTRVQFFIIAIFCSFAWYILPGFLFPMLSSLSWVCWVFPNSVLAQQLGSGLSGLGLGSIGLDWSVVVSYLGSPLSTPWFALANVGAGFFIFMYVIIPLAYWNNIYDAKKFPLISTSLFQGNGERYNVEHIITPELTLDITKYQTYGRLHLTAYFALIYGLGFAALSSTVSHVICFYGKDIWRLTFQAVKGGQEDVHTRLMRSYRQVPQWWFHVLLMTMIGIAVVGGEVYNTTLQLPWWGILMACGIGFVFTLPISIIAATTNMVPGLNVITEYIIGYVYPGRPVANASFKTYGYISMVQAIGFLSDFKLGHYMKIPPISMFIVQLVGTVVAASVSLTTAWWMLTTIPNICDTANLPVNSPWTCPTDRVFFNASVIWGLVGPRRIFGNEGLYKQLTWFFLVGLIAPIPVKLASMKWPNVGWLRLINMPILIAGGLFAPATSVNYITYLLVGFIFNFVIFKYRKAWWSRYNYLLSAALDCGLAFMGIALYFLLQYNHVAINWWGVNLDNCPLAQCPTLIGLGKVDPTSACPAT